MALLEIRNLSVSYEGIQALQGVSVTCEQGDVVSIVGANGAGKSSLIAAISGVVPARGEIWFEGSRIDTMPAHRRPYIGIVQVPEGRRLFPHMSVEDNLRMGGLTASTAAELKRRMDEVYQVLPALPGLRKQMAGTLSGGQQQMAAIGRALMAAPRVLMLDEPSLGLAPVKVRELFEIIRRINGLGTTLMLSEQNVHKALELATRGYVLENGRVVLTGTGQELLHDDNLKTAYLGGVGA
jgi:branched-chain amino acid transport system ATP-binding protein